MVEVSSLLDIGYLISATLFIFGIKMLGSPKTAPKGNMYGALGMFVAVLVTVMKMQLSENGIEGWMWILLGLGVGAAIGYWMATTVEMTGMPELVALFNGFGGAASALVALSEALKVYTSDSYMIADPIFQVYHLIPVLAIGASALVGWMTLTGSLVAMFKLKGGFTIPFTEKWIRFPTWGPSWLNYVKSGLFLTGIVMIFMTLNDPGNLGLIYGIVGVSCLLGILFVLPIGGADMPVVVSLLNSLSGIAAAFTGFVVGNTVLIIAGSMVGAAGLILTFIMCKAMNRELFDVLFKAFGGSAKESLTRTKVGSDPEEVAMVLDGISKCIIVPGYGMAVSQSQHLVKEFADILEENDVDVSYAIHPVAGRMPGHMNVLLAEADVPYEQLCEMEEVNSIMPTVDVAIIIGANDVVNPAAVEDESSPIFGMPIVNAYQAKSVFVLKRGQGAGYSGIINTLFFRENCRMIYGDAKATISSMVAQFDN